MRRPPLLELLAQDMRVVEAERGVKLAARGQANGTLYILVSGEVMLQDNPEPTQVRIPNDPSSCSVGSPVHVVNMYT